MGNINNVDMINELNDNCKVPFSISNENVNTERNDIYTTDTYKRRIEKEYKDIQMKNNCISEGITLLERKVLKNDIIGWNVEMTGIIEGSEYFGKCFKLIIIFPIYYPSEPPIIQFCDPINHEMIDDKTSFICISSLRSENWSCHNLVSTILIEIQSIL